MNSDITFNTSRINAVLKRGSAADVTPEEFDDLRAWLEQLVDTQTRTAKTTVKDDIIGRFRDLLHENGIREGRIAELGGPNNSIASEFPEFDFEYLSLFPAEGRDDVQVADITQCDYIPSNRYDAVFSMSVLEHVSKPWLAAQQITRILKPDGITFHMVPFSYFYHGAPADYWRVTPDALSLIFSSLEPLEARFIGRNRRRDNRGSEANPVDKDGGEEFAVDAFGGWRESWQTLYCGRKNLDYAQRVQRDAQKQLLINLMKCATLDGHAPADAASLISSRIKNFTVSIDGELSPVPQGSGILWTADDLLQLWTTRGSAGLKPSYARFVQWRIFNESPQHANPSAPEHAPSATNAVVKRGRTLVRKAVRHARGRWERFRN